MEMNISKYIIDNTPPKFVWFDLLLKIKVWGDELKKSKTFNLILFLFLIFIIIKKFNI